MYDELLPYSADNNTHAHAHPPHHGGKLFSRKQVQDGVRTVCGKSTWKKSHILKESDVWVSVFMSIKIPTNPPPKEKKIKKEE